MVVTGIKYTEANTFFQKNKTIKYIYTSKYIRPAGFPYLDVENIKGHKDK